MEDNESESIILLCDSCNNDLYYILENGDICCGKCDRPQINLKWIWTDQEEEYVELELENGSKTMVIK